MPEELAPVWCDLTHLDDGWPALLAAVQQAPVSGVLLRTDQLPATALTDRIRTVVRVEDVAELDSLDPARALTVLVAAPDLLAAVHAAGDGRWQAGLSVAVDDAEGLRSAVEALAHADVVVVSFADETNIPLELIVAEAQAGSTTVVKAVRSVQDALVARGVLERGPDAALLRVSSPEEVTTVARALITSQDEQLELVGAEVTRVGSIGTGMRGCVDTAALFRPDEGIVVGSTSWGGLLVCAEVHHLPYMNLRPFRVNAGAVHSYVWAPRNRTQYVTDLAAGGSVLAVATDGRARPVLVGRVKTEMRPLRLIECRLGDHRINTIVQDDWHVRLFDADGAVRNSTDIRPGDRMLAMPAAPGRHVGIAVSEQIEEN